MLSPLLYYLVLLAVSAYAFSRGRADERIAAVTCILATFATNLAYSPMGGFARVELGVFAVDSATLAAFTFLALRSERFWPLWMAGLQLTTVIAHVLKAIDLDLLPQAYAVAARFWVYPIFLVLVIGTWRGSRRSRLAQPEPAPA
jgi:hypothetical protein